MNVSDISYNCGNDSSYYYKRDTLAISLSVHVHTFGKISCLYMTCIIISMLLITTCM